MPKNMGYGKSHSIKASKPTSTSRTGESRPHKMVPTGGSDSQAHDKYKSACSHGMKPGPYNKTV